MGFGINIAHHENETNELILALALHTAEKDNVKEVTVKLTTWCNRMDIGQILDYREDAGVTKFPKKIWAVKLTKNSELTCVINNDQDYLPKNTFLTEQEYDEKIKEDFDEKLVSGSWWINKSGEYYQIGEFSKKTVNNDEHMGSCFNPHREKVTKEVVILSI